MVSSEVKNFWIDGNIDDSPSTSSEFSTVARDPSLRKLYSDHAIKEVPRLLTAVDRNPFRETYGCFDREYWHFRTSDFPSEMYQEAVWPLALIYKHRYPNNRWQGEEKLRELAIAGMHFAAKSCHADGSCDDYYPYERALGAAVFSFQAATAAYQLLDLRDEKLLNWFAKRARWIAEHQESGNLTNHHALAALALLRYSQIIKSEEYRKLAWQRMEQVLAWQNEEGWFEEYGGADPGYQTVTLECLLQFRALEKTDTIHKSETYSPRSHPLDRAIQKGIQFAWWFLHPDGSYGGEYGSRGTFHFYPLPFEILCKQNPWAADLAEGCLKSLQRQRSPLFCDDRLYIHRLGSFLESFLRWTPERAVRNEKDKETKVFNTAQIWVKKTSNDGHLLASTVVSAARGGIVKVTLAENQVFTDCGLLFETNRGKFLTTQKHSLSRLFYVDENEKNGKIEVSGFAHECKFETVTPSKSILLRIVMLSIGRFFRDFVRNLLQKRLITGRKKSSLFFKRHFYWKKRDRSEPDELKIIDHLRLDDPKLEMKRMAFASDLQTSYVAATNIYQASILQPWQELPEACQHLNRHREVIIERILHGTKLVKQTIKKLES
ncbi:Hypothetical protein PBC10988_4010 [Planctomycetales bacterium 10988]|nr:Hypothetical protein PBC10988_4010 [Planctomycetales bacterium 10988]